MFEQLIAHHARIRPDALAVIAPDRLLTFRQFDADIAALESLLAVRAPLEGVVGVAIANPIDHWVTVFALSRLGYATLSFASTATAPADQQALAAGIAWVVSDAPLRVSGARVVVLGPHWRAEAVGCPRPVRGGALSGADLARVTVSSGSTGKPKLIGLSRDILDLRLRNAPLLGPLGGGRLLSLIGIDNWAGFFSPLLSWATSGAVIFPGRDPRWAELLVHSRPELLIASPMHLAVIMRSLPPTFTPYGLFRVIVAGGAMPVVLAQHIRAQLTPDLFICYASTECGFSSYGAVSSFPTTSGAAGYTLPWAEVEVVDDADRPLPPGEIGAIRARGAEAVSGYYQAEDAGGDFRNGWFYPGDLGALSTEGLLTIAGRTGEVMNCGGVKIAPLAVEDALLRCPGVRDAAAVAVSRPDGFDRPVAAVVVGDGFDLSQAQEAIRPLGHDIAVIVVDAIPRTPGLAKIVREAVREKARAALSSRSASGLALN